MVLFLLKNSLNVSPQFFSFNKQGLSLCKKKMHTEGPASIVNQKIVDGILKLDLKQSPIVISLQRLYENIHKYSPGKFMTSPPPKGLYIYGTVGVGKTMLMDIFYDAVKISSKKRSHFNNFMADVHSRIHQFKETNKMAPTTWGDKLHSFDPIKPVAKQLVKEAWLLCFDEFQVTDIADAMILKKLFTEMFNNGMVLVATSNKAPDDLYQNGISRDRFLPFIPILKTYCDVIYISGKDYRIEGNTEVGSKYLIIENDETKSELDNVYKQLCQKEKKHNTPKTLKILGHKIAFKRTCGRVLYTTFEELCERPLASQDYIEIANNFDIIIIKDVPKMTMENRNPARRFIILIDTLYDKKVRIMMSAVTEPQYLFSDFDSKVLQNDLERITMDDLDFQAKSANTKANLFSGSEEVFAFQRTVSRLIEMCSNNYWDRYKK